MLAWTCVLAPPTRYGLYGYLDGEPLLISARNTNMGGGLTVLFEGQTVLS